MSFHDSITIKEWKWRSSFTRSNSDIDQIFLALGHSQENWPDDSTLAWHCSQQLSISTLLLTKFSFAGRMSLHTLHVKWRTLCWTLTRQMYFQNFLRLLLSEVVPKASLRPSPLPFYMHSSHWTNCLLLAPIPACQLGVWNLEPLHVLHSFIRKESLLDLLIVSSSISQIY